MSTCKVYGTVVNGSGEPIEGMPVYFRPAAYPSVTSSGIAVYPSNVLCLSTSSGYFECYLLVDTDFVVTINPIGLKQVIRIPAEVEANLFTLTGMYSSGDPTPGDTNPTENNW